MEEREGFVFLPYVWYYAEDRVHYERASSTDGRVLVAPEKREVDEALREGEPFCVIAPYLPPKEYESLFVVKALKNTRGALTSQEDEFLRAMAGGDGEKYEELYSRLVEEKLGLKVFKPKLTLRDMGGMLGLKRYASIVRAVQGKRELRVKGIFLVGIPGTGKSFSAKCMAGELGRYLVELNLAKIIEHPNPVFALHRVFEYIESLSIPCLLWIDEVEKMFSGSSENERRVFGQLLTIMNDLNTPTGYRIDGIFWVTANNIMEIMQRNPEFLRKGRFDELFFVDLPLKKDAMSIFGIYVRKYRLWLGEEVYSDLGEFLRKLIQETTEIYDEFIAREGAEVGDRFIYTPAEIEQITKEVARRERLKKFVALRILRGEEVSEEERRSYGIEEEFYERVREKAGKGAISTFRELKKEGIVSLKDYEVVIRAMEPLAKAMKEAIRHMRQQSKIFRQADEVEELARSSY